MPFEREADRAGDVRRRALNDPLEARAHRHVLDGATAPTDEVMVMFGQVLGELVATELLLGQDAANRIPLGTGDGLLDVRAVLDGASYEGPAPMNDLFAATVEAVEEAVVNALFTATTTVGRDGHVLRALPLDRTLEILARYGRPPQR